jgi:hypothetical protein
VSSAPRFGLGNLTFDAPARHGAFCDRTQLYDLTNDPLEQTNLATPALLPQHRATYDALMQLLLQHVATVEAANPAVARRGAAGLRACAP